MAEINDLFSVDNLSKLYDVVRENPSSVTLSVVGLVSFLIAILFAYKAVKSKPEDMKGWMSAVLFMSLGAGIIFSLAGPAISLIGLSRDRLRGFEPAKVPAKTVLANLEANTRVDWLIRLIPYSPTKEPELSLNRLTHLGRPSQRYTFLADYAEVRGYTAKEAVLKVGGSIRDQTTKVSAIMFPLTRQLYPANARGLLQVVGKIDATQDPNIQNYRSFDLGSKLNPTEKADLEATRDIASWSWKSLSKYYAHYCELAQEFRCQGAFTAKTLIGDLSRDWHPLGFARGLAPDESPCAPSQTTDQCNFSSWQDTSRLRTIIGARVFLMENMELSAIGGRILIDFDRPDVQVIPDLGVGMHH
jgi:hypothetical protein